MTGAQPVPRKQTLPDTRAHITRGLSALVIGGAVLIAAIWLLAWQLADMLARAHVQEKMHDVATKAASVLREPGAMFSGSRPALSPRTRQALADLARFRDIHRLELRDAQGNVVWRNTPSISRVKRTWPASKTIVIEKRNVDGLMRSMARYHTVFSAAGTPLHLVIELDATPQLATYHHVAMLVAKAISTVVVAAILLMGWMLIRRIREREALLRQLEKALQAEDGATPAQLRHQLEELSARNAAMLRRLVKIARTTAPPADDAHLQAAARRANGKEA